MKKLITGLLVFLVLVFLVSTFFSVSFLAETRGLLADFQAQGPSKDPQTSARFHFLAILPQRNDPFFSKLAFSLRHEAETLNLAVEIRVLPYTKTLLEISETLEMAALSRIDGVVLFSPEQDNLKKAINLVVDSGIPVVTVESDSGGSHRQAHIGTNSFQLGQEAGKLIRKARPAGARVGVILTQADTFEESTKSSLILGGLNQAFRAYPTMEISVVKTSSPGIFSGEETAYEILTGYPRVNALFAASSKDTISAAQALIDLNRVGEVTLIGLDDTEQVKGLMSKKIVYGSVVRSPANIASLALGSLIEWKEKKNVSSYTDAGVSVLTYQMINPPIDSETGGLFGER